MRRSNRSLPLAAAVLFLVSPGVSHAWNYTGHRVIASIAYRQLDEATRARVADVLKSHPAASGLWNGRPTNGPDAALNLFWNASVFPDDARRPPFDKYNRPTEHYVNYRILGDQGNKVEPPLEVENVINSYASHLRKLEDPATPAEEKALRLSWVFHQAGDVHQPLHTVARFSKALPQGDRGGNSVVVPNPRARGDRGNNLHAYWDDLIGGDDSPDAVNALADGLIAEYPRDGFREELARKDIGDWTREGVEVALKTVYNNLDPEITKFADLPVGYEADGKKAARRRAALAGYRLGDDLKRLFAGK